MKDHVDESMGIVTVIVEALTKIKHTESSRFANLGCVIVFYFQSYRSRIPRLTGEE